MELSPEVCAALQKVDKYDRETLNSGQYEIDCTVRIVGKIKKGEKSERKVATDPWKILTAIVRKYKVPETVMELYDKNSEDTVKEVKEKWGNLHKTLQANGVLKTEKNEQEGSVTGQIVVVDVHNNS